MPKPIWAALESSSISIRSSPATTSATLPHPEPYLTAARRLGAAPRHCVAFEDSLAGVRAAHAAGMRTVMVPDLIHPTEDIKALCHAVIDSLEQARFQLVSGLGAATGSQ